MNNKKNTQIKPFEPPQDPGPGVTGNMMLPVKDLGPDAGEEAT